MVLFEQYRILHRDVSVNNTMIYVADVPQSEAYTCGPSRKSTNDSPRDDNAGDNGEKKLKERLVRWDRERRYQIQSGVFRSGLLIDFDYVVDLDQPSLVAPGDRTVRLHSFILSSLIRFH